METILAGIRTSLMDGDAQGVKEKTEKALAMGIAPKNIILQGLVPAMQIIGHKFRESEIYIPDVLMASRAMHAGLYVLKPLLTNTKLSYKGRIVIGTVAGDLHDIGKNMVSMMLQGAGYEVIDVGIDVPAVQFVQAVKEYRPDILAMSALLTTTMVELRDVITELKKEGLRNQIRILVGGGPVTPEFALAIEADAYAADSYHAAKAADRLMKGEIGFFAVA